MPTHPSRRSRPRSRSRVTALVAAAVTAFLPASASVAHSYTSVPPADGPSAVKTVPAFVSRMTARFEPYTDSAGNVWAARSTTLGTTARSTALVGTDIKGTSEDALYAVNAQGVTGYRLPVPVAGTYRVRLLMAEEWATRAGQRVFDVTAEGSPGASDIDIVGAVGKGAARDVVFEVPVTDGRLDLGVEAKVNRSLISAIEVRLVDAGKDIVLTPQAGAELFAARSTASYSPYTDTRGRRWAPRSGFIGSSSRATTTLRTPPPGGDAPLYETLSYLDGYRVEVPMAARYQVRVLFTENWFTVPGRRVFDVTAEGRPFIGEADPVADAGHRIGGEISGVVEVTDGRLDLSFVNRADRAQISAIEVTYFSSTQAATPDSGAVPSQGVPTWESYSNRVTASADGITDRAGHTWSARPTRFGAPNISSGLAGKEVEGTDDDELYRTNGWGSVGYLLDVPEAATYHVRVLMAEDFFREPGARVFDIVAEGKTVAANVDIVKAVGDKGRAYDLTVDVPVTDGELSLKFVARVNNPLVSAIEVTAPSVPLTPRAPAKPAVPTRAGAWPTADISQAPRALDSDAVVADLTHQVERVWNGKAGVNAYAYNAGFYRVPSDTPKIRVGFDDCQRKGYTPDGLFVGRAQFVDVPIPAGAIPAAGTDAQLTIYDPAADKLWEFWQARKSASGAWTACWGGRIDDVSTSDGVFDAPFGATATGLSMGVGMISIAEAKAGRIEHAMYLGVLDAKARTQSWPANRNDGNVDREGVVTEGQRLRLDPSIDVTKLGLTPFGVMVARAAQKYGFVVADRAGAVSVVTESGAATQAVRGENPWDVLLGGPEYEALSNFPWDELEALPVDYGRP